MHIPRASVSAIRPPRAAGASAKATTWAPVRRMLMVALIGLCGCCPTGRVDFIAVREAQIRSASVALPLNAESRRQLLMFLTAGGNNDNLDGDTPNTVVYPDAEQRWGGLLDALENSDNLDAQDLSNGTFAKWFRQPPMRQVVDAREERAAVACPPFAERQERFVWIFKCFPTQRLGQVFVQLSGATREQ